MTTITNLLGMDFFLSLNYRDQLLTGQCTFHYWDGTGHRWVIQVRKGDSIGEFLWAVQQQLAPAFREQADPIGSGLGTEVIVEAAGPDCIVPGQNPPIKLLGFKVHPSSNISMLQSD
ncbi:hypothetical protein K7X08_037568 [Anisodus acutangulus]|uniref:Uncharacterized protein n=1 Tax=Anisodus acutangulus TaxID=402998 RepID=A0A9Q1RS55_9SOLA|nr:hypothetical protein K7X08_037568 [Anisodus acutangulus]